MLPKCLRPVTRGKSAKAHTRSLNQAEKAESKHESLPTTLNTAEPPQLSVVSKKKLKIPRISRSAQERIQHNGQHVSAWAKLLHHDIVPSFIRFHFLPRHKPEHSIMFHESFCIQKSDHRRIWLQTMQLHQMMAVLDERIAIWSKIMKRTPTIICNMEGYNFGILRGYGMDPKASKMARFFSDWCEVGGLVQSLLALRGIPCYMVQTSEWKKLFCGAGNADKYHIMLELQRRQWFDVRCFNALKLTSQHLPIDNGPKLVNGKVLFPVIPKPYQDMFDSIGIALSDVYPETLLSKPGFINTFQPNRMEPYTEPKLAQQSARKLVSSMPDILIGVDLGAESPGLCIIDLTSDVNVTCVGFFATLEHKVPVELTFMPASLAPHHPGPAVPHKKIRQRKQRTSKSKQKSNTDTSITQHL